jgi:hypothetical protein
LSPSGLVSPTWPALPCAWSSHTSLMSSELISSSVATRSWLRAWATGDTGEAGTALTGVCACGVSGLLWLMGVGGGCWPLDGRALGECWCGGCCMWGVPYGVVLEGEAVWRCWANCWWAGDGRACE